MRLWVSIARESEGVGLLCVHEGTSKCFPSRMQGVRDEVPMVEHGFGGEAPDVSS